MGHSEDTPRKPASSGGEPSPLSSLDIAQNAVEFTKQAGKLSHMNPNGEYAAVAVEAHFVTPQDPVIITSDGSRLPGVPLDEAHKLNVLREELEGRPETVEIREGDVSKARISSISDGREGGQEPHRTIHLPQSQDQDGDALQETSRGTLRRSMPPSHTNPLFPPLPLYGPPSLMRNLQCVIFRVTSFFLSLAFLGVIVLGALFTSIPTYCMRVFYKMTLRSLDKTRPFYAEEQRCASARREKEDAWVHKKTTRSPDIEQQRSTSDDYPPTEGGKDLIICDVSYYARRVGLDVETFKVQTEDGFIIELWHVYDPKEYTELDEESRCQQGPGIFQESKKRIKDTEKKRKFPVLLMHGLLQSSGAYCCNDDQSLAFWLCKSGYDVWLGNNRCGFKPEHTLLKYSDPRMWCWNIRQMGVFDLPALTSRVLSETGFEKIGLICHSQGTTQTFVALAKEQRPDLGEKFTVFCALAPAAYAGPLIGKMYFKFMRVISPAMFRLMFGIHAFIPFMMQMHSMLNPRLYGWLGYKVFSFLFDWSDQRWDRGLRDRMFQFAPVYVSAESMRWWLGRECFAKHKCILATKEVLKAEERMDEAERQEENSSEEGNEKPAEPHAKRKHIGGSTAWYNEQVPPFALWVCGDDDLVDGKRLLRRFDNGREPYVKVVHSKVIPKYQHLDVIWAMDAVDQVFLEIREVLWKTCNVRDICRVPEACDFIPQWKPELTRETSDQTEVGQESSNGSD